MTTERLTDEARHSLKIDVQPMNDLLCGAKTGEVRNDDRGFSAGNWVDLLCADGRIAAFQISHIQRGYGLPDGICVLSYRRATSADDLRAAAKAAISTHERIRHDAAYSSDEHLNEVASAIRATLSHPAPAPQPADDLRVAYVEGMRAAASISRKDGFSDDWLGMTCAILAEADAQEALAKIAQEGQA